MAAVEVVWRSAEGVQVFNLLRSEAKLLNKIVCPSLSHSHRSRGCNHLSSFLAKKSKKAWNFESFEQEFYLNPLLVNNFAPIGNLSLFLNILFETGFAVSEAFFSPIMWRKNPCSIARLLSIGHNINNVQLFLLLGQSDFAFNPSAILGGEEENVKVTKQ